MKGANSGFIHCQVRLIKYPDVFDCGFFKYMMYMQGLLYLLHLDGKFSSRMLRLISEEITYLKNS